MIKYCLLFFLLCACITMQAQEKEAAKVQFGLELDALPYATGGYFGGAWVGKDVWRVRALTAFVKKPDWSTKKDFSNHQVHAYALLLDRFLKKDWKGWWIGAGVVYWHSTIQTDAKLQTAKFDNYLLNGSLGYNFTLYKHLYLSPWGSLSLRVAGDKNVAVDNKSFTLPVINPEASLKVGFYF
ncbi:hypothetical protein [Chitinophaga sancti]|uniref:Outer membrane protein beta-barrel domain-containing protein n=1 Tax=Chitinophaga sancti TaxID=1004 RepID=A0A1K1SJU3_9BACT|nr:hypothetical protein [Chitinophaga sancti]WQD64452.1 hypothetical protein U0033_08595 [Chitinophaga sancti]WQG89924.1 hypothetical protein SR876_00325 [Chitinophaga sancti]SFW84335.1 hypothetical protein SAMN05661012_05522 [Chitinophaga sancti]